MNYRIRIRLLARLLGSLLILSPVTVALWAIFTFGVALAPLILLDHFGIVTIGIDLYRLAPSFTYPTVSGTIGVSPAVTTGLGYFICLGLVVPGRKWASGRPERQILVYGLVFLSGLLTLVEATALLSTGNPIVLYLFLVGVPIGGYCVVVCWRRGIRTVIGNLREDVLSSSDPAENVSPAVDAAATRLATQAGIPAPKVCVLEGEQPISYALGPADDPLVVVTSGLLDRLDESEIRAVLAHEISHLINRDVRMLELVLIPVYYADVLSRRDDSRDPIDAVFAMGAQIIIAPIRFLARAGFAFFSVGRERAADIGAASLCGDPAALAGALRTLDEDYGTPATDLRSTVHRAVVLNIVPPAKQDSIVAPFNSHPSTEKRIRWLRELATDETA